MRLKHKPCSTWKFLYKTIIINKVREVGATKVFIVQKFYASILIPARTFHSETFLPRFSNTVLIIK